MTQDSLKIPSTTTSSTACWRRRIHQRLIPVTMISSAILATIFFGTLAMKPRLARCARHEWIFLVAITCSNIELLHRLPQSIFLHDHSIITAPMPIRSSLLSISLSRTTIKHLLRIHCLFLSLASTSSLSMAPTTTKGTTTTTTKTRKSLLLPWKKSKHDDNNSKCLGWCQERLGGGSSFVPDQVRVSIGWTEGDDDDDDDILSLKVPISQESGGAISSSLWPAGIAASILFHSPQFQSLANGKDLLELGSGLGLAGMVAGAAPNVKNCILTDNDEDAVQLLQRTIDENKDIFQGNTIMARELDWRENVPDEESDIHPVDIVIGADIAYYFYLLRPILDTTQRYLTKSEEKDGIFLVVGPSNRQSLWDLYYAIKDGCYNQLTDTHEPPWNGKVRMLLYRLDMSLWMKQDDDDDDIAWNGPNSFPEEYRDGIIPMSVVVYQTGPSAETVGPFSPWDYIATKEDDENIMKTF